MAADSSATRMKPIRIRAWPVRPKITNVRGAESRSYRPLVHRRRMSRFGRWWNWAGRRFTVRRSRWDPYQSDAGEVPSEQFQVPEFQVKNQMRNWPSFSNLELWNPGTVPG